MLRPDSKRNKTFPDLPQRAAAAAAVRRLCLGRGTTGIAFGCCVLWFLQSLSFSLTFSFFDIFVSDPLPRLVFAKPALFCTLCFYSVFPVCTPFHTFVVASL